MNQSFYRGSQFSKPVPKSRAIIGRVDHISAFVSGVGEQLITIDGRKFAAIIDLQRFPVAAGSIVEYRTHGNRAEILAVQAELLPEPLAESLFNFGGEQ